MAYTNIQAQYDLYKSIIKTIAQKWRDDYFDPDITQITKAIQNHSLDLNDFSCKETEKSAISIIYELIRQKLIKIKEILNKAKKDWCANPIISTSYAELLTSITSARINFETNEVDDSEIQALINIYEQYKQATEARTRSVIFSRVTESTAQPSRRITSAAPAALPEQISAVAPTPDTPLLAGSKQDEYGAAAATTKTVVSTSAVTVQVRSKIGHQPRLPRKVAEVQPPSRRSHNDESRRLRPLSEDSEPDSDSENTVAAQELVVAAEATTRLSPEKINKFLELEEKIATTIQGVLLVPAIDAHLKGKSEVEVPPELQGMLFSATVPLSREFIETLEKFKTHSMFDIYHQLTKMCANLFELVKAFKGNYQNLAKSISLCLESKPLGIFGTKGIPDIIKALEKIREFDTTYGFEYFEQIATASLIKVEELIEALETRRGAPKSASSLTSQVAARRRSSVRLIFDDAAPLIPALTSEEIKRIINYLKAEMGEPHKEIDPSEKDAIVAAYNAYKLNPNNFAEEVSPFIQIELQGLAIKFGNRPQKPATRRHLSATLAEAEEDEFELNDDDRAALKALFGAAAAPQSELPAEVATTGNRDVSSIEDIKIVSVSRAAEAQQAQALPPVPLAPAPQISHIITKPASKQHEARQAASTTPLLIVTQATQASGPNAPELQATNTQASESGKKDTARVVHNPLLSGNMPRRRASSFDDKLARKAIRLAQRTMELARKEGHAATSNPSKNSAQGPSLLDKITGALFGGSKTKSSNQTGDVARSNPAWPALRHIKPPGQDLSSTSDTDTDEEAEVGKAAALAPSGNITNGATHPSLASYLGPRSAQEKARAAAKDESLHQKDDYLALRFGHPSAAPKPPPQIPYSTRPLGKSTLRQRGLGPGPSMPNAASAAALAYHQLEASRRITNALRDQGAKKATDHPPEMTERARAAEPSSLLQRLIGGNTNPSASIPTISPLISTGAARRRSLSTPALARVPGVRAESRMRAEVPGAGGRGEVSTGISPREALSIARAREGAIKTENPARALPVAKARAAAATPASTVVSSVNPWRAVMEERLATSTTASPPASHPPVAPGEPSTPPATRASAKVLATPDGDKRSAIKPRNTRDRSTLAEAVSAARQYAATLPPSPEDRSPNK